MHILIFNNTAIPALKYGGTERVIWWLGKSLVKACHQVTFLVAKGSYSDFAQVIEFDPARNIQSQIPSDIDIVHAHCPITEPLIKQPTLYTIHGATPYGTLLPLNSVFVSKNHAQRHGSTSYIHNGLDFEDYGNPNMHESRNYFHFLGKAAWRIKNVKGAISIATACKEQLAVIGGHRLNFKMGFRFTPHLNIHFFGMLGGEIKNEILRHSKGLIFPVLWHEPFGIAITESLYFGCPIFGTPYGSLPELVPPSVGFLSASKGELIHHIQSSSYDPEVCHTYVVNNFDIKQKAQEYLHLYQRVLNGESLNITHPTLQHQQTEKFLPFYD